MIKRYIKYKVAICGGKKHTRVKMHNLFRVDENSLKQCCAAHVVQFVNYIV